MNLSIIKAGGITMVPLSIIAVVCLAIIIDKLLTIRNFLKYPQSLIAVIENYKFDWQEFEIELNKIDKKNYFYAFFVIISSNKNNPIWWIESRAGDEAKILEQKFSKNLWLLETIATCAPLLGLLGTIFGMMSSFKIIGTSDIINPAGVSAGVAESLIATACGLVIALMAFWGYNYFSKIQNQLIDYLERLGTRLIDHIKIDNKVHEN
ncbi:MAG: MotA/TolQ/ExbB proton channel family protein [Alphaproteobacteria bacterium]|nr:MotA/TolQ/ExbB proton channel family protein [Alphaproteobacteria bacterium]